jgi:ribosomal protein L11 methyltransferase
MLAPVRVILANIISSVLVELLPIMAEALERDGAAIISGILLEERDYMLAMLVRFGWVVTAEDNEGIWWSASIARG